MKTVAFYITDHGYGHASRQIAVIQEIMHCTDWRVVICANYGTGLLTQALKKETLKGRVIVRTNGVNDIGFISQKEGLGVDVHATLETVERFVESLNAWVKAEKEWCANEGIDLIVTDIVPWAFRVAKELNVSSVGVSNFDWHSMYKDIFPEGLAKKRVLNVIEECHKTATIAFRLPFSLPMETFKQIQEAPLLARTPNWEKVFSIREKIDSGRTIVYFSIGKSFPSTVEEALLQQLHHFLNETEKIELILSKSMQEKLGMGIAIPKEEPEPQNYLAAADLAIIKAGYSTVAEAITAKVPMMVIYRPNVIEDTVIAREVKNLGIGRIIPYHKNGFDLTKVDLKAIRKLRKNFSSLPERYRGHGAQYLAHQLKQWL